MKQKQFFVLGASLLAALVILQNSCITEQGPLPVVNSKSLCDSLNVKWSADIQPIIFTQCLNPGCHDPGAPNYSGYDLSGYNEVKAFADQGRIKARVLEGSGGWMPPPPNPKLSASDMQKVDCWLKAGAPNN